jgi:hypothetical protein
MPANDETAPLLGEHETTKAKVKVSLLPPTAGILFAGFIISLSFSYTQTP